MSSRIKVSDLEATATVLFEHLRELGMEEIEITDDYYWEVPGDQLYDPLKDPHQLDLGQLSHDLERLGAIRTREQEPIAYGLVWFGAVVGWIGRKVIH
jgi:hypothetical protein